MSSSHLFVPCPMFRLASSHGLTPVVVWLSMKLCCRIIPASIIASYIFKFLTEKKSNKKNTPIIVYGKNIQIVQGDSNIVIQTKIQKIIDASENISEEQQKALNIIFKR
ncbi:MAG: hypothetical protein KKF46_05485 [Nanoarchaeota archaeon]|nr:hypothetical protein [Nanoarchaeota archaeon]MBU1321785.1 hypothetical protein [Nanoarchaeota archaeon]MBU1598484.1 hypothetical protein [Nanoarchaeota archaeon]MBU2440818.1 hypothetical protein [Nanoarchaeota archaeon]